ncbi:MAG: hypothetical protein P9X24_04640, partial [Candidatus Hatepunaea meridiana]|nr:hypothetical protein [Candidatus Hatepunaea meridiana]
YRYVPVGHILGTLTPEKDDDDFETDYYKRVDFDVAIPVNMTDVWLIIWLKKKGTPTGNLTIMVDSNLINKTDVSTLTTSYQKFVMPFGAGNITREYVPIQFNGSAAWDRTDDVIIGAVDVKSVNSHKSSDGISWSLEKKEMAIGLTIQNNQKAIADQINEETVMISKSYQRTICPGGTILNTISIRDTHGTMLDVTNLPRCKLVKVNDDGTTTQISQTNIVESESVQHRIQVKLQGNETALLPQGASYVISCNETSVKCSSGIHWLNISTLRFSLKIGTEAECNYSESIGASFTQVDNQLGVLGADLNNTAQYKADVSGLATSVELFEVNQSLTNRIISEIGGLGNLTLAEIWAYGTRALTTPITGSGENMSAIADISTLLTEAQFNLNTSQVLTAITTAQSNVQTSIYGLANTTASQVWAYATRALSTPIATDDNQNMTGISDTTDISNLLTESQFDKNVSDVRDDITGVDDNPWDDPIRQLTSPIATDNNQNMTGIAGTSTGGLDSGQNTTLYLIQARQVNTTSALTTLQRYFNCSPNYLANSVCERLEYIERAV